MILKTIISPSVDTEAFRPPPHRFTLPAPAPAATTGEGTDAVFTLAFAARLAPEKSPGMFLLMARSLLDSWTSPSTTLRFLLIGDGMITPLLKETARTLGLQAHMSFEGWVDAPSLRLLLARTDVLVNPSLRAWSETFCIANIEAMAMGIPVVTFGVGGIGEYVYAPDPAEDPAQEQGQGQGHGDGPLFEVTPNAVLVNDPSPEALAAAALMLFNDPSLRITLGRAARATVEGDFSLQRQMVQYDQLYTALYHRFRVPYLARKVAQSPSP